MIFFFKQKTAYEMRISDWSSDVCSSDLRAVVRFDERTVAAKIDRALTYRGAARSVVGMAAILAHEVKNPLSGIRGAAQLLELNASQADRELTRERKSTRLNSSQ